MQLKKLSNLTVPVKVKAPEPLPEPEPLYQVHNHCDFANWHLLPFPEMLHRHSELPNLVHSFSNFDKETGNQLRKTFSNKVVIVTDGNDHPDFDLCDALQAQNFQLYVGSFLPENKYRLYILKHYTSEVREEDKIDYVNELCWRISFFPNALERDDIIKNAAKVTKVKTATLLKQVNDYIENRQEEVQTLKEEERALPKWIDRDRYELYGFDWLDIEKAEKHGLSITDRKFGIYFSGQDYPRRLTNFTLKPLFHIPGEGDDNRRFTELCNGYYSLTIEMPTKAFISLEFFNTIISGQGNYYTMDGFSSSHLNRLKAFFLKDYPKCLEMKTLGWQSEGFFSYSNAIYKNQLLEFDSHGMADVDGINYLSMGASSVLAGIRQEDDLYRMDKYLLYIESEISFKDWCKLMTTVYSEHGMMGIAWCLLAIHKDIVFKRNNNCPIPYAYGIAEAGKSTFVESVCSLFTNKMPLFNLGNGTTFALFEQMRRFRNVLMGFNEFDENTINEEWFRAFKGVFDGEGRMKGTGKGNKIKSQDINCLPALLGQYLSTKDDSALLMRCLPCKFAIETFTDEQKALHQHLKDIEKRGITSLLCDIIQHRTYIAENYNNQFAKINSSLRKELEVSGTKAKTRVLENYTAVLTLFKLHTEVMDTGLSYDNFYTYCKGEIVKMSSLLSESNSLAEFWKVVEFLLDQEEIEQGYHYKIEAQNEIRLHADRKSVTTKSFEEPKKLLYLRFGTIHALYLNTKKQQTGKPGLNEQTILTYLRDQDYYIGTNPSSLFRDSKGNSTNTSSYILDYDLIGANLERFKQDNGEEVTIKGKLANDGEVMEILGKPKLAFRIYLDEIIDHEGTPVKKQTVTNCFYADLSNSYLYKRTREVVVTGYLTIGKSGFRNLEVKGLSFLDNFLPETDTAAADEIFGKENQ